MRIDGHTSLTYLTKLFRGIVLNKDDDFIVSALEKFEQFYANNKDIILEDSSIIPNIIKSFRVYDNADDIISAITVTCNSNIAGVFKLSINDDNTTLFKDLEDILERFEIYENVKKVSYKLRNLAKLDDDSALETVNDALEKIKQISDSLKNSFSEEENDMVSLDEEEEVVNELNRSDKEQLKMKTGYRAIDIGFSSLPFALGSINAVIGLSYHGKSKFSLSILLSMMFFNKPPVFEDGAKPTVVVYSLEDSVQQVLNAIYDFTYAKVGGFHI